MPVKDQTANVVAFGGNTMVYESVKRYSLNALNELMRVLMENVDDALFEITKKAESDHERNLYFEAMRDIRLKRESLEDKFNIGVKHSFDDLIQNDHSAKVNTLEEELSLVEQSEIEDSLAIENMIAKARPHFEDDLFAVEERLRTILHRRSIKHDQNPLDPKAICDSFHSASEELEVEIEAKLVFYKLFDQYVMSRLGNFYRELNEFFILKGVLPEFDAAKERLDHTSRLIADRVQRSTGQEHKKEPEQGGTDTPHASGYAGQGNVLSFLQHMVGSGGHGPGPGPGAGVVCGGPVPANTQAISGEEPVMAATGTGGAGTIGIVGGGHITALTSMQSAPIYSQPVQTVTPASMKAELNDQIVAFRQNNSQHASAADNQLIDIVSMLFDFFFDDETLPDPIKVLIGRLQIPILKVAMLDDHFFNSRKHPARRLLDNISKAAMGWNSDISREQLLIDKIEKIVNHLLNEFDEDVSVFEQALDEFLQFIDAENQKIEANQQKIQQAEQEKEQRIGESHQAAEHLLVKLESKHDFSFEVIDFLQGIWKSVLFNAHLSEGGDSVHWRNLKKISSTLIWTLIPKHSEEEKNKLLKTLPPLLRALSRGMELVQIDKDKQNLVFQMLVLEHAKIVKQTSKNIVTRVDDKTVWPEENVEQAFAGYNKSKVKEEEIDFLLTEDETGEIQMIKNDDLEARESDPLIEVTCSDTKDVIRNLKDFTDCIIKGEIHIDEEIIMDSEEQVEFHRQSTSESDDYLEQAQALEIGQWVEFVESGAQSMNAKLSWKSNVTGKFVFVNRQGHKVRNMTIYGFATELRAGRAKIIENDSVFDRAINSFMSGIRH